MSQETGEDIEQISEETNEQEKDIAEKVLDNILKMSGIEKSVQVYILHFFIFYLIYFKAQNVFKLNGKKTAVRISNKGLTLFHKRSFSCFSLKNKYI